MRTPPLENQSGQEPSDVPVEGGADEELLAAFVGRSWNTHYRDSFAALRSGIGNLRATFNLAAALAPLWLAYRGFFILQFVCFIAFIALWFAGIWVAGLAGDPTNVDPTTGISPYVDPTNMNLIALALAYAVVGAAQGLAGDKLLYRRAVAATSRRRLKGPDREALLAAARKAGGVSVKGVVLTPVIFLLLAIAFLAGSLPPESRCARGPARCGKMESPMKSDLLNLITAEEDYFADSSTYSSTLAEGSPLSQRFGPSIGVTVTIGVATATGFNAMARSLEDPSLVCGIFVGDAAPPIKGQQEGEPKCEASSGRAKPQPAR